MVHSTWLSGAIMKKIAIAGIAALIGTPALAADMAVKAPPPPLPPPCIWCGFYIGLNGGWAGTTGSNNNNLAVATFENGVPLTLFATPLNNNQNTSGGFGGGQIGYNLVFPGGYGGGPTGPTGWLVGVEADIQGASLHRSSPTLFFIDDDTTTVTTDSRLNWFGTLRGRLGFATGPVLFYGTGGLAFGGVKNNLLTTFTDVGEPGCFQCFGSTLVSNNSSRTGWVLGAGIEWMFAPNWSLKGEYQYIDLGSVTNAAAVSLITDNSLATFETEGATAIRRVNENFNTVRIGVNYHFGGPALGGY
jgi:outer membrane immunogenic protein